MHKLENAYMFQHLVLLMEGSALVKPCNVDDDDNDYSLLVYNALLLPQCFPTYYQVVWLALEVFSEILLDR